MVTGFWLTHPKERAVSGLVAPNPTEDVLEEAGGKAWLKRSLESLTLWKENYFPGELKQHAIKNEW